VTIVFDGTLIDGDCVNCDVVINVGNIHNDCGEVVATLMEEIDSLVDRTDDVNLSTLEVNSGLISKTDGSWSGLSSSKYKYVIVGVVVVIGVLLTIFILNRKKSEL
jgi:hypothetical protein